MLKKNIYIMFPAGYSGTYVRWAIEKSEKDLALDTIDDPINRSQDLNLGGVGTAHGHTRIPTHQTLVQHLAWVIRNRPAEKKIYILNTFQPVSLAESNIGRILCYDPDPVFIYIHDANNPDNRKYGAINTLTKWPIFFKANQIIEKRFKFDSFNCKDSLSARNLFFRKFNEIFPYTRPLDQRALKEHLDWHYNWYHVRNSHNPHEVNDQYYLEPSLDAPKIYEICLADIVSGGFVDWLKDFCSSSDSGEYNTDFVQDNHQKYIDVQPHLRLFQELQDFRTSFKVTGYLRSHSLLQSFVMMELRSKINDSFSWKTMDIDSLVDRVVQR